MDRKIVSEILWKGDVIGTILKPGSLDSYIYIETLCGLKGCLLSGSYYGINGAARALNKIKGDNGFTFSDLTAVNAIIYEYKLKELVKPIRDTKPKLISGQPLSTPMLSKLGKDMTYFKQVLDIEDTNPITNKEM